MNCESASFPERDHVLALLKRYGRHTTSFQVLEPGLRYWMDGDDACVAYADTGGSWVAAGGPIAAPERKVELMQRFAAAARSAGKRVRFFGLERDVSEHGSFAVLHIGTQPLWNPQDWQRTLAGKKSLREQLRRARAKGVTVRRVQESELSDAGHPTRQSVDGVIASWLASRPMAPLGFVVNLHPYDLPEERRFLVAERDGVMVGMLVAVPIYSRAGWLFEDVLRTPSAPNGTIELLFDHAMRLLATEGSEHVTFGLAPLSDTPHTWLRRIRDLTESLYDFDGLRRFKAKLMPASWQPVYLAYPAGERGVRAIIDSLEAFAGGSFVRFGWQSLVHRVRRRIRPRQRAVANN